MQTTLVLNDKPVNGMTFVVSSIVRLLLLVLAAFVASLAGVLGFGQILLLLAAVLLANFAKGVVLHFT